MSVAHQAPSLVLLPILVWWSVPQALGLVGRLWKQLQCRRRRRRAQAGHLDHEGRQQEPAALCNDRHAISSPEPLRAVRARCEAAWLLQSIQDALSTGEATLIQASQDMLQRGFGLDQGPQHTRAWAELAWALHQQAGMPPAMTANQEQHATDNVHNCQGAQAAECAGPEASARELQGSCTSLSQPGRSPQCSSSTSRGWDTVSSTDEYECDDPGPDDESDCSWDMSYSNSMVALQERIRAQTEFIPFI